MIQIVVLVLSLCLLGSLIGNVILYSKCENIREEKDKVSKEKDKAESFKKNLISIEPGHRVIYPDYGLTWTDQDKDGNDLPPESFKVTYELEVLEVTENKLKIKAVDITSEDKIGRDPANKFDIINFMKNKWVDKNKVQLIVDDSVKRDLKLKQLGIE